MATISPEQYQELRDRLSVLLDRAVGLPGLLPKSEEQIKLARKKLLENQFELVLVGEFQGGKSTTFNVLTGGREISPRGKNGGGLKTSGCIIRASHITESEEEEHAIVSWRTNKELLMGFENLLRESTRTKKDVKMAVSDEERLTPSDDPRFDLSTSKGRQTVQKIALDSLKRWREDPTIFPTGEVDMIRFALLTTHFYNHPLIKESRGLNRFGLDEVRKLTTFPEDWEDRWSKWSPEAFSAEEIIVAFISRVDLRIRCERLARMGAAIVDCPGMFASPWDTQVAETAITSADAILYLIPGDRALALNSLNQLQAIRMTPDRIFLAPNVKNVPWSQAEKIAKATAAILVKEKLDLTEERVRPYSALLALYGKQLGLGIENLDTRTRSELALDLKKASEDRLPEPQDKEIFRRISLRVNKMIASLLDDDDFPCENVSESAVSNSRVNELFSAVELFVINSKAKAIIEGNASRAENALTEIEGALKYKEDAAKKQIEECEQQIKEADLRLKDFEEEANRLLSRFGGDAPRALGTSLKEHILSGRDRFLNELADSLGPEIRSIAWSFEMNQQSVTTRLEQKVQARFDSWTKDRIASWVGDVTRGENVAYNEVVKRPLSNLISDIMRYWNRINRNKPLEILQDIDLPTDQTLHSFNIFRVEALIKAVVDELEKHRRSAILTGILGSIAIILFILVLTSVLAPPLLALLLPLLALLYPDLKDIIWSSDALKNKLKPAFESLSEKIGSATEEAVSEYISEAKKSIDMQIIKHPRDAFQARCEETRDSFNVAEGERLRLAEKARIIREKQVTPLREELTSYLKHVHSIFNQGGQK